MLFTLRYRRGAIGVMTGLIEASSLEVAEKVGRHWCNQEVNCRYISVVPAIIADESILPADEDPTPRKTKKAAA